MTLGDALESRMAVQHDFEKALTEKVQQIQRHYDNPNLNEKQLMFLKKDEEFCKVTEAFANKLIAQINFLLHENQEQKEFMKTLTRDIDQWKELYINKALELNQQLRQSGSLKVDYRGA